MTHGKGSYRSLEKRALEREGEDRRLKRDSSHFLEEGTWRLKEDG